VLTLPEVAKTIVGRDPARAVALWAEAERVARTIPDPKSRAWALMEIAKSMTEPQVTP
jgi:hypothetical protein